MNRNMKEENSLFFSTFKYIIKDKVSEDIFNSTCYFTTNDEEKEWLIRCEIETFDINFTYNQISTISFRNNNYIVVFSDEDIKTDQNVFIGENINSGMFLALINTMSIKPNVRDWQEIAELLRYSLDDDYKGHDFGLFLCYYTNIKIFRVAEFFYNQFKSRDALIGYFIATYQIDIFLAFDLKDCEIFKKLFLLSGNLPYQNMIRSLLSNNYRHSFLELYQCFELFFPFPHICNLHKELTPPKSILELYRQINEELSWNPKEHNAIELLFTCVSDIKKEKLSKMQNILFPKCTEKLPSFIYNLRNFIVHNRLTIKKIEYESTDNKWSELIGLMADCLYDICDEYKHCF